MNGMNDQQFHDLAMKVLARQATEAERAELDSLLTGKPQLKAKFERLRVDVRIGTELLPVVAATDGTAPEFPASLANGCKRRSGKHWAPTPHRQRKRSLRADGRGDCGSVSPQ